MNKLTFKPLEITDAKLIFDNREFIVSYFSGGITKKDFGSWKYENELEDVKKGLEEAKLGRAFTFLAFNEEGEYIGKFKLHSIGEKNKLAHVSISVKEKFWGHGYGTQIVKFLEKLAFSKFKLNRLEYGVYSNNPRSQKLVEKLGFKYEGTLREAKKIGSKYFDRLIYSKLKSEYKK